MTAACVLASGLAYALSMGVAAIWPLAWLAPLPILWLALRVSLRRAAVAAFLAYALGRSGGLPISLAIVPLPLLIASTLLSAAAFAVVVAAARAVALRLDLRLYALAFPLFFAAWEQLAVVPVGAGAELGFSQADLLPLVQVASLAGVVGVGFLVSLAPATIATVLALRERGRPWRAVAAAGFGPIAAALAFGLVRLVEPPAAEPLRVGVAVSDETVGRSRTERADEALPVVDAYAARVAELARRGAQVVVLPEKFVGVTPAYAAAVDERFSQAAASGGVWLVAGLNRVGRLTPRNVAVVFAPDGRRVLEYDKVHLVPGYEDAYVPGRELGMLASAPGPWAVAVCRDLIVPELGRRLARAGAGIVFAPAWDFVADGPLESRVARLRAIEGGFALVRVAQEGIVTVSDPQGRVRLAVPSSSAREVLEVVEVSPGLGATLYARAGDWFGLACIAGSALLLLARWMRSRSAPQVAA